MKLIGRKMTVAQRNVLMAIVAGGRDVELYTPSALIGLVMRGYIDIMAGGRAHSTPLGRGAVADVPEQDKLLMLDAASRQARGLALA